MGILLFHIPSVILRANFARRPPREHWLIRLRHWVDQIPVTHPRIALWICRIIPATCPFERTLMIGKYKLQIPAFCKLNPLYNELVALRFRALIYLSEMSHWEHPES